MKKIFMRTLLAIALLLSASVARAESGTCGTDITWTLSSDGVLTISGSGEMRDWDFGSLSPFFGNNKITTIVVSEGVTSIGTWAFPECFNLTSVELPSSVTNIGSGAFSNCGSLSSIELSSFLTNIGDDVFYGCQGLSSLEFPSSVTNIGNGAFSNCSGLTSIEIPSSVTTIGNSTFMNCTSLLSVQLPSSINSIGENAFSCCGELTSIEFPSSLTSIGDYAFSFCTNLTSLKIPSMVTSLGSGAFSGCSGLSKIILPSSVKNVGYMPFGDCSGLTTIYDMMATPFPNGIFNVWELSQCTLYVPTGSIEAYQNADGWNGFGEIKEFSFGTCGTNLSWTLSDDGVLTISGSGEMTDYLPRKSPFYRNNMIKSIVMSEGITSIGGYAFYQCANLTSLELPSTLTSIGEDAFYACGMTSVAIPSSVTSIGSEVFRGCSDLTSIQIPSSVTSIGSGAFQSCSGLTSIVIPSSVTSIGSSAFSYCNGLISIEIPSSVTSIGNSAFQSCKSLTSIEIPSSVTNIGSNAFSYCDGLTSIVIPSSVTSIGEGTFERCTGLTSIEIPVSVTSIGRYAFESCEGLTSIEIPTSVTSIDYGAFMGCFGLTSFEIPSSVTSLGGLVFSGCDGLTSVYANMETPITYNNFFLECVQLNQCTLYVPMGTKELYQNAGWNVFGDIKAFSSGTCGADGDNLTWTLTEDGVLTISGNGAMKDWGYDNESPFYYNNTIKTVVVSEGVTNIGRSAFAGCSGLTSIELPSSLTSIGDDCVFGYCTSLTSIKLPLSLTSIGSNAFEGCSNLTSIEIPASVTKIGAYAFSHCPSLTSITVDADNPTYDSRNNCNALIETRSNTLLAGCSSTIIPASVKRIGYSAFVDCYKLTSIEIPASVTNIGSSAFSNCSSLISITIPSSVTSIGHSAFVGCRCLTSIVIPSSVTDIGESAFSGCISMSSITVDANNSVYDSRDNCNAIIETATNTLLNGCSTTVIPTSVTSIADYAFSYCSDLSSITIPSSVTSIGRSAFEQCSGLTSIVIPPSVTGIGDNVFAFCVKLASIELPSSLTSIGHNAFRACSSLTEIELPSSLISIDTWAFMSCSGLTSIVIPSSVTTIGDKAFSYCDHLTSVVIPASVTTTGSQIFYDCSRLRTVYALMETPTTYDSFFDYSTRHYGTLYVPIGSKEAYSTANGWKDFANIVEIETDLSQYDNVLYPSDAVARTTTTVSIPINLKNNVTTTGYSFSLRLPLAISPSSAILTKSNARKDADGMSFNYALQSDGSIKVVCYASDGQPFSGNDSEVCTLSFQIPADMPAGDYPITISDIVIAENAIDHVVSDEIYSRLTVEDYLLGDANADRNVSVADLSAVVNYILNLEVPETFNEKAADANENGKITVADLSAIVNIILYGSVDGPSSARSRDRESAPVLSAAPLTLAPGQQATLYLQMDNANDITAFQFDALLPDGITCTRAKRSSLVSDEHSFRSASLEDNLTRIVCYSGSNATFAANEGTVAELTIQADQDLLPGLYALNLQNAEVVSLDGSAKIDAQAITFEVVAPTGIEMIEQESEITVRYDLMGHRVSTITPCTIFIEHGKKAVIK